MHTFKVGDLVRGVDGHRYSITNNDALMEVSAVSPERISVIIRTHKQNPDYIGQGFRGLEPEFFKLIAAANSSQISVEVRDDFTIKSGELTHDEQKDFYTALQKWKLECEELSASATLQETEDRGESLHTQSASHHSQLGDILSTDIGSGWGVPPAEPWGRSFHSVGQATHFSEVIGTGDHWYQHTPVDSEPTRSPNMDRAGEQGRSSHIIERAQRERDRDGRLNRFFGRSYRTPVR